MNTRAITFTLAACLLACGRQAAPYGAGALGNAVAIAGKSGLSSPLGSGGGFPSEGGGLSAIGTGQAALARGLLPAESLDVRPARPQPLHKPPTPYPYPTPALPHVGPGQAAGVVLDAGKPAEGVKISLIGPQDVSTRTDANGIWRVKNLPEGEYWLHYYNDSDRERIGYWQTPARYVDALGGAAFPAFDVHLQGFVDDPPNASSVNLPYDFRWVPYALAIVYRFRVHDKPGPGGKPLFISSEIPADRTDYDYNGVASGGGRLRGGHYLWGVWWDAGEAGEGGNLYQEANLYPAQPAATASSTIATITAPGARAARAALR